MFVTASPLAIAQEPAESRPTRAANESNLFMERVLDNREASWRRLGDFLLHETETFSFEAPLGIPLSGFRREYEWYVRNEVVVRSPVRFDGVDIDEDARREYEEDWLREERRRGGRPGSSAWPRQLAGHSGQRGDHDRANMGGGRQRVASRPDRRRCRPAW